MSVFVAVQLLTYYIQLFLNSCESVEQRRMTSSCPPVNSDGHLEEGMHILFFLFIRSLASFIANTSCIFARLFLYSQSIRWLPHSQLYCPCTIRHICIRHVYMTECMNRWLFCYCSIYLYIVCGRVFCVRTL